MPTAQISGSTANALRSEELENQKETLRAEALRKGQSEAMFEEDFQRRMRNARAAEFGKANRTAGVKESVAGFVARLDQAPEGWEEDAARRKWKQSLLLIKPEYCLKHPLGKEVMLGDVAWLRFSNSYVAGLKQNEQGTIECRRTPNVDALIQLGAIDESERAEVKAKIDAPKRELFEKLKAELEG